uniref:ATPase domain containing protein n=1 Tax=viral metagenome TaxID=1070528 RepID=A0A6M3LD83_9ZZZZ
MVGNTIQKTVTADNQNQAIRIRAIGEGADICIFSGKKYEGKSYLAKKLLATVSAYLIWDEQREHGDIATVTHDLRQIVTLWNGGTKKISYQPIDKTKHNFRMFCKIAQQLTNAVIMVEEIRLYQDGKNLVPEFKRLLDSGRFRGLGIWTTSRRMHGIPVDLPYNADHIFVFKQYRPEDLDYLSKFMDGEKVQQLPTLEKYWFLHYIGDTGTTEIHKPV